MRPLRTLLLLAALSLLAHFALPAPIFAQPEEGDAEADTTEDEDWEEDEGWEEDADWQEDEEPQLERPDIGGLQLEVGGGGETPDVDDEAEEESFDDEEDEAEDEEDDDELPSPDDAQARLDDPGEMSDPTRSRWTTPQTVFDLHGYFRVRTHFQDNFFLNRVLDDPQNNPDQTERGTTALPFSLFRPRDDGARACDTNGDGTFEDLCNQNANAFGTMRLRLEPTIHLSDDVRVRMQIDVFNNQVLGGTPDSLAVGPLGSTVGDSAVIDPYARYNRTSFAPFGQFSSRTANPPIAGINNVQDSIVVRRAWAEVRNRGLGELRFGRMGSHWGLGMLANGGSGIDSDYQSDIDRILLTTRLAGIYLFGAYDFAGEGLIYQEFADLGAIQYDQSRLDDVTQFVFGAAYRQSEEEQRETLQRGDAVFNVGAYFAYRNQALDNVTQNPLTLGTIFGRQNDFTPGDPNLEAAPVDFVQRGAEVFVPDLWLQLLYEDLRIELEAAFVVGTIRNLGFDPTDVGPFDGFNLLQFGAALELEYHVINDQLGLYFYAGYASGDSDVEGLNTLGGLQQQQNGDDTYSTFAFHPNYRIDLIFWRTIMRQVSGAYYFRPGISYDFIKNNFGQLLGARADLIWSRASNAVQSWGNADDLGIEVDASIYFRSEDGPDLLDGFYAMLSYGIFFPLDGVGYLPGLRDNANSLANAQTFRLLLGVQY